MGSVIGKRQMGAARIDKPKKSGFLLVALDPVSVRKLCVYLPIKTGCQR